MTEFITLRKRARDYTGQRIGKLTVLGPIERRKYVGGYSTVMWLCKCDCGNTTAAQAGHLASGKHSSCGCGQRARASETNLTHGATSTAEWSVWRGMKRRCNSPRSKAYPRYGGRGIRVCDRWQKFENFLADMGKRPGPEFELDREDNDRGYEPGNCRWVRRLINIRNSSNPLRITANGVTRLAVEWAEDLGISPMTLRKRLSRGWTAEDAVSVPKRHVSDSNRKGATHYSKRAAPPTTNRRISLAITAVDQNGSGG